MSDSRRLNIFSLRNQRGLSLLDVIFAIGLMLLVFVAIFGGFRLSLEIVSGSKARTGAVALANEQIEYLRSLSYSAVGTVGGIPAGAVTQNEQITLNQTLYNRRTFIEYVDDPADGVGAQDGNGIPADYKRAKVELTWTLRGDPRSYALVTTIVPKGIETITGGGTLSINVFNALGAPIQGASVRIVNSAIIPTVDVTTFSDPTGKVLFPGSPSGAGYQITVTKDGYSMAQTYSSSGANPNPSPGHLSVALGQTTSGSFAIDSLAEKSVRTWGPPGPGSFQDLFTNQSKLISTTSVTVSGGAAHLYDNGTGYEASGSLISASTTPSSLSAWGSLSFNDAQPSGTSIRYHLLYATTSSFTLVPESDLPGNATGFASSSVSLSSLTTTAYPTLAILANLTSTDASVTPEILDWELSYDLGPVPLPNIPFSMRGYKTIGTDGGGAPVYKYSQNLQTDSSGSITLSDMEWDSYLVTIDSVATGYDISESCKPQPTSLSPGASETLDLTLSPHTTNSLLVSVTNASSTLLSGATVRLQRSSPAVDTTKTSSTCGQTFFSSLSSGIDYSITVTLAGYQVKVIPDVDVSGSSVLGVVLDP